MAGEDTTIRIGREEKAALERAREVWERKAGRRVGAGEFVQILAQRYLSESERTAPEGAEPVAPVGAQGIRPAQALEVAQGPQVSLVQCARCGGQIGWRLDLGTQGFCPHCGALLQLAG